MRSVSIFVSGLLFASAIVLPAQTPGNPASQAARAWRQQHERAILDEFVGLLSIPNVSRDAPNIRRNADAIVALLSKRGVTAKTVSVPGGNPVVFGELRTPGATRTLGFYAHYDGQPLDEKQWASPPFTPTLRTRSIEDGGQVMPLPSPGAPLDPEARLYARSASDDKAPIIAIVTALDALRVSGMPLKSNLKFMFDGEEEAGSPHLFETLSANRALFAADVWLMCDGPVHQTRRPLIAFGTRDVVSMNVTVYGPRNELHSGHYGNWAPNPALMLSRLLVSMKDARDRVVIDRFYDDIAPLSDTEKRAIAAAPVLDAELKREFWLGGTEGAPAMLGELITQPSLNIRGMSSAQVGAGATNVIPSTATASIDIRLVKGMDPRTTVERVLAHIRAQGFFVVDTEPAGEVRQAHARVAWVTSRTGRGAVRTPMDLPISQEVIRVVNSVRGPAVLQPNMGGSLPLAEIEQPLGVPTIVVPIANHDNRQHSFNENLRIQNLWDGIELLAALLVM
jgi:acetylornithine deacetylase/succinyl-diaminopimelate desuccinylase-like protein